MPVADVHESTNPDMSWIDIAVLGQKRGVVILDYAPGWSDFMDEMHFADAIDGDEPDHLAPGAYRWSGFTVGSWEEGDRCVVKGGTFTRAAPPAMDRKAVVEAAAISLIVDLCGPGASQSATNVRVVEDHLRQFASTLSADAIRQGEGLPQSVVSLIIAAREAFDTGMLPNDEQTALDKALEPFASSVSYANEPASHASDGGKA